LPPVSLVFDVNENVDDSSAGNHVKQQKNLITLVFVMFNGKILRRIEATDIFSVGSATLHNEG
jgi:hypothetical protein